ncbi:RNA-binding protein 39 isoform X1 [Lingula anatina]|uniref:RNA-binding protein 39 isoform X1 n=1 Tax=Lingula anatina TaxID=7574 RepID=A0A1S3H066_LINAN|nr:RNA-binding protein 39 isoform X1 [Lingula anatina]XP_013379321.1 RNA-binding protein 39 isoform X1 [Lingula anatina]XP_013379322.1 RNA-binding protein 39 isoform X1 [Lingula anatina]|eukprot:XP_013379319.1 RNA-binding protein 39 isoform X1 [Lingula anatina]
MADDLDVEALLEAPYKKEDDGGRSEESREKESRKKRSRSRERDRDRKRDKDRDRDRDRKRSRSRDRKDRDRRRSRSRDRDRDRERSDRRKRSRSRDRDRDRRDRDRGNDRHREDRRARSTSRSRDRKRTPTPIRLMTRESHENGVLRLTRGADEDLTPEERDARTVFCMQLAARIRPRDLEEFFSSVGKVRDVRIITDNKTRRSKGIAYVEFYESDSVPLAIGLSGQRLLGVPIIVQASQAEKNRVGQTGTALQGKSAAGPMRLYVGSLHFNITEDMLRGIFDPFGKVDDIKLIKDPQTGRSQGYGFATFHNAEDALKALQQLNGFELAGRPMKVGHVTERTGEPGTGGALDSDEMDRAGIDLGATGRLQLMAKLAEGTGFQIPQFAANALNLTQAQSAQQAAPPIATQCFMLSNMFDPITETNPSWDQEIKDDVIEECNKHGGVIHIYVDKASPQGNVYVKCPSIAAAVASVNALHGRWFAGKMITAAYVPLPNYHSLFPDSQRTMQLLMGSSSGSGNQFAPVGMGMNPLGSLS